MDNYAAHKKQEVRDWLAANPRITVHRALNVASRRRRLSRFRLI